jgi:hypothetical protein
MFDIELNDPVHFLLPQFQTIQTDEVLYMLKRLAEAV